MFENLTDRLGQTLKNVRGKGRLTEDNIKETLREVRMALLEADVVLPVAFAFVADLGWVYPLHEVSLEIVVRSSKAPKARACHLLRGHWRIREAAVWNPLFRNQRKVVPLKGSRRRTGQGRGKELEPL